MGRLDGKVAIITGAAGGIGLAATKRFVAEGARVMMVDLRDRDLEKAAQGLDPARVGTLAADVTQVADTRRYVAAAARRFGGIDIMLCNAGIEGVVANILDYPVEVFDKVLSVNVRGVWLGLKYGIPQLRKRGKGSIVITASTAGIKGSPLVSAYITSKHAVVGMMRSVSQEFARENIRVNCVNPSATETRMMRSLEKGFFPDNPAKGRRRAIAGTPMHRYAQPQEVAALMLFLASDESAFCNGGVYTVDGGRSAT
jgi:NAD(P)-dependent dehydrogenase (short-subunit alcohol dehydrogenase family)